MKLVPQKILAGFLSRNELQMFLLLLPDVEAKKKFWTGVAAAQKARAALTPQPLVVPAPADLPREAQTHLDKVVNSHAFQDHFGGFNSSFQLVQLDQLVPVQTFINLEHHRETPKPGDLPALLDYCLPANAEVCTNAMLIEGGARFWSNRYGHSLQNVIRRVEGNRVVLSLEHPNVLQVRRVAGRLLVFNGNHRAYELLHAGHKVVPALVIEHATPAEVPWLVGPMFWVPQVLLGERPPLISDFDSPLAVECRAMLVPSVIDVYIGAPQAKTPGPQQLAIQIGPAVPQAQ